MLRDMVARQVEYSERDGERYFDAAQNARLIADAERYYRVMYYGGVESWNLRDRHMFETLQALLLFHGPDSKAVVWEHNSHLGDAAATEMGIRGELNVGPLCREAYGDRAFLIGFGTDHGTVAAASAWDGPMQVMKVRPAHPESYERLCHDSAVAAFLLHLREPDRPRFVSSSRRRASSVRSASSTAPRPSSRATTCTHPCPTSSTSTSGSTRPSVHPITEPAARGFPRSHPFSLYGPA